MVKLNIGYGIYLIVSLLFLIVIVFGINLYLLFYVITSIL